ncbi:MAG: deoxyribodipyrimidine photo-lyase, partial [Desulfovibrionales bacterium]
MSRTNTRRSRVLRKGKPGPGPVVYWMSRDQRASDNWALIFAQEQALARQTSLIVLFCLVPGFCGAGLRQYRFMLQGLEGVQEALWSKNIGFAVLQGQPGEEVGRFLKQHRAGLLVCDFDPLKIKRRWQEQVVSALSIPAFEVDARNIVPCWEASDKQEYAARTIRSKIHSRLDEFLDEFPELMQHPAVPPLERKKTDWDALEEGLRADRTVAPVDWLTPGEEGAREVLDTFIQERLKIYDEARNDPNQTAQSDLSPYLHFGQIAAQRVAQEVLSFTTRTAYKEAFLEELIVRRELSDNFCFYNPAHDSVDGFPEWAGKTLDAHRKDPREHVYSLEEFEQARTHDPLWNAAQMEMVTRGKMHGYMRMYWAKKILEWTASPEEAMHVAITLNDRWELDGRDSNGYTGIAWSIGGVHDRAWP